LTDGWLCQSIPVNPDLDVSVRSLSLVVSLAWLTCVFPARAASPLSPLVSLEGVRPLQPPPLLSIGHRVDRYWQSGADEWQESQHTLAFHFEGRDGQWSPAWRIEQERFTLAGHQDDDAIRWQGREDTLGFGWRSATGHRVLVGPHRYELRSPHGHDGTVTLGWVTPSATQRLSVVEGANHWQVEADLPSDYVYLEMHQDDRSLHLRGSELGAWRVAADQGAWSLRLLSDRDVWPVVSDDWDDGTASLRKLSVDHRRVALAYRPQRPGYLDTVGVAFSRWTGDGQAIVPSSPSPVSVSADARFDSSELWVDNQWLDWRSRIAVRYVEPTSSGRESSVFFPGVTDTWPPFPIRDAVLLGARLQWQGNLTAHSRMTFWLQQWIPLYYSERDTSDSGGDGGDGSGGGDSSGGGTPPSTSASNRQNRGGFQAGFVFSLH